MGPSTACVEPVPRKISYLSTEPAGAVHVSFTTSPATVAWSPVGADSADEVVLPAGWAAVPPPDEHAASATETTMITKGHRAAERNGARINRRRPEDRPACASSVRAG